MFKNKSYVSAKKVILLASALAIGCGGIVYLGYHQGAHRAPLLAIKTLGEATKGNLNSLNCGGNYISCRPFYIRYYGGCTCRNPIWFISGLVMLFVYNANRD